ncbi:hypothetical protein HDU90_007177 [Geranomyces variabilis]|nr:hypothetical protein HDU90_007177 [Geranomyces variabilis]
MSSAKTLAANTPPPHMESGVTKLPPLPATRQPLVASRTPSPLKETAPTVPSPSRLTDSPTPTTAAAATSSSNNISNNNNSNSSSSSNDSLSNSADAFLLLTTFLAHVAQHAYPAALAVADKQPTNTLVREFRPVLRTRIAQLAAREAESESDEDDDDDDEDEDVDGVDDGEDSTDSGSSSSSTNSGSETSEDAGSDDSRSEDEDDDKAEDGTSGPVTASANT